MNELIGVIIGLVLTLFIYSYAVGDNPLYQLSVHILVGVSAAYASVIAVQQIIWPVINQIRQAPTERDSVLWLIPLFFVLLLLLKRLPSLAWLGNMSVGLMAGVGAAVALMGALVGTIWPQVTAVSETNSSSIQALLVAIFTIFTLLAFRFNRRQNPLSGKRPFWRDIPALIGRSILTITFGTLFAALLSTSFALLSSRISYYLTQIMP
jgi:hypothetical protein